MGATVTESATDPARPLKADPPQPWRPSSSALNIAAVIGFAAPVLGYLMFIGAYGVNVIWGDQWAAVDVVGHSYNGTLTFGTLWAQINQERMFVPNLLALVLAHTTHFNQWVEMYLSAALLLGAVALVILAHRRRSPGTHWLWYCPVAILMLSVVQYENSLTGFQIGWYIILFCLAAAIYLLDTPTLSWTRYGLAAAAGLAATFSSIHGLIVWAVGFVLLLQRRRSRVQVLSWLGVTAFAFVAHFADYNFTLASPHRSYPFHHLWGALQVYFTEIGDVLGFNVGNNGSTTLLLLGLVIFVVAVLVLVSHGLRFDTDSARPVGVALLVYGLIFPFFAAMGNIYFGLSVSRFSRMTTYDLLIFVGLYLALVDRVRQPEHDAPPLRARLTPVLGVVLGVMLPIQFVAGLTHGISGGQSYLAGRTTEADVLANYSGLPKDWAEAVVYPFGAPKLVERAVRVAERQRFSLFSTALYTEDRSHGLLLGAWSTRDTSPLHPWQKLRDGQTIEVKGAGFRPSSAVVLKECSGGVFRPLKAAGACREDTAVTVSTDGSGAIDTTIQIYQGNVGNGRCDAQHACFVQAQYLKHKARVLAEFTLR